MENLVASWMGLNDFPCDHFIPSCVAKPQETQNFSESYTGFGGILHSNRYPYSSLKIKNGYSDPVIQTLNKNI